MFGEPLERVEAQDATDGNGAALDVFGQRRRAAAPAEPAGRVPVNPADR